ncbi:DUF5050 domain-containing protein [Youngiibacter multivorans]|uniref:Prolow-density lipoprotein receptor-related protein 1-like beta-propeller domain-containing protein n=1 Tax=Youngiibacter multivorans TaxID=937251 RepID=A0ABS4G846_9CLOT|nr:DUF5050 domain-containing protein [Youngiibacter multivorans]MBP1920722.1 hypothetical protein [Youngiibacter multivorans]
MEGKIRISILAAILFAILFLSACSSTGSNSRKMGNTNSNISNGGMSVMHDGWLYFMNYSDKNALYKVKPDGTGEAKVSDDMAYYLNSYGDWIYYCNGSDGNKIYKMKPDGTEKTLVIDNIAQNIIVAEDWIYYINYTDEKNTEEFRRIFKVKTDGTDRQKVNSEDSMAFNMDSDWIYFNNNSDQKLYKLKTDGSGQLKVSEAMTLSFSIFGDHIYYVDSSDGNNKLWRMKLDGTGGEMLTEEKVSAFNASGEWIYYGNTQFDTVGLELKKMKLDGKEATVINDDDPMSINVNDDMLVYLGFDFTSFGIKQTIMKSDGSGKKDYVFVQTPQAQDFERHQMNEKAQGGPITVIVTSAYSTNILKNDEPGFEATVFDNVTDGAYLFVNMEVWNESSEDIDLYRRTGIIPEIDAMGLAVYWSTLGEITDEQLNDNINFHLKLAEFGEHIIVKANDIMRVQAYCELSEPDYPVYLGLFDGETADPLAVVEVLPGAEHYVTSWSQSYEIIMDRFPGYDITQLGGVGYKMADDTEETIYYGFELKKSGETKVEHYLVKRDTGVIYIGAFDDKMPDYPAVPIKPLD